MDKPAGALSDRAGCETAVGMRCGTVKVHVRVVADTARGNAVAGGQVVPRGRGRPPIHLGVATHPVDDQHDELLEYVLRLDSAWQHRVGSALRQVLPTDRAAGFWLRTGRVENPEAGEAGKLDVVVVSAFVLAHLEFGASPAGERWQLTTRTRAWPLRLIASITTETLPAESGGLDGLLVTMHQPGGAWDVQLLGRAAATDGAATDGLAGVAHPAMVRIVVDPVPGSADQDQQRRQRAEYRMLSGLARAVHQQMGHWSEVTG